MVTVAQATFGDRLRTADAFRDVLAGHLEMNAARVGSHGLVHCEEPADFGENAVEGPRLVAGARHHGIAVHRIAGPPPLAAFALDRTDQRREALLDLVRPHPGDDR